MNRGPNHHKAKLNERKVAFIRSSAAPTIHLARLFKLHPRSVRKVRQGIIWKHVL